MEETMAEFKTTYRSSSMFQFCQFVAQSTQQVNKSKTRRCQKIAEKLYSMYGNIHTSVLFTTMQNSTQPTTAHQQRKCSLNDEPTVGVYTYGILHLMAVQYAVAFLNTDNVLYKILMNF